MFHTLFFLENSHLFTKLNKNRLTNSVLLPYFFPAIRLMCCFKMW